MNPMVITVISVIGAFAILIAGGLLLVKNFYIKVAQGEALIVNKTGGLTEVSFNGGLVLPVVHRAEVMDISLKTMELRRQGKGALICADKIRADIQVTFYLRVNKTEEDVQRVASSIGCRRASDQDTLEELFLAKFSEALKTVGYQMRFEDLYKERDVFKEAILREIGTELNGYKLDAAAIDYLEQTPKKDLDEDNVLDAEGIRAITEITAQKKVETNDLENNERKRITKQNVETREAVLALERQQAAAEAGQAREVANVRSREKAEIEKVNAEEHLKAQMARIKAEEEILISEENKHRQIEVAKKNRERVVAVEHERVEKERMLQVIDKEREVALQTIEEEKAVEKEKKEIADIIRGRIVVEKTVAEEEERIKDLRVTAEARRAHDVIVINAEAEAQEGLVKDIKKAEAQEKAATHEAKRRLTLAEAELEAADKHAKAQQRLAEGAQAQHAAEGLALARVKEADAVASEKKGFAEARVEKEKYLAAAVGTEAKGTAEAKAREALANAIRHEGTARADVEQANLLAHAKGEEEQGMARMRVLESEALVVEKRGFADAAAIRETGAATATSIEQKLTGEARGLAEKAKSMLALDEKSRAHEEFRISLEKEKEVELRTIDVGRHIAIEQAKVLSSALTHAKIDIVGGDGQFFDRFVNAVSVGKGIDAFVNKSAVASTVLKEYTSGERSLPNDVRNILERPALSTSDIQNVSVVGFLSKLVADSNGEKRKRLHQLLDEAKKLGIDDAGK